MSHFFARCASQKTHGHARIARVSRATCKNVRQNLIPRAIAYSPKTFNLSEMMLKCSAGSVIGTVADSNVGKADVGRVF